MILLRLLIFQTIRNRSRLAGRMMQRETSPANPDGHPTALEQVVTAMLLLSVLYEDGGGVLNDGLCDYSMITK